MPMIRETIVTTVGADGRVHTFDAGTGKERWVFPTPAAVLASPVVGAGELFIAGGNGSLYAFS